MAPSSARRFSAGEFYRIASEVGGLLASATASVVGQIGPGAFCSLVPRFIPRDLIVGINLTPVWIYTLCCNHRV